MLLLHVASNMLKSFFILNEIILIENPMNKIDLFPVLWPFYVLSIRLKRAVGK